MLFTNSIKFPDVFNLTNGNTNVDTEFTSINRCIGLILTTAKGELLGDPDYGCTLYERLFNGYNEAQVELIKGDIVEALTKYEKRIIISVQDIEIEPIDIEEHKFKIHISYILKNSDIANETFINIDKERLYNGK